MNPIELPDISKKLTSTRRGTDYTVRWKKFDLSDPADLLDLSNVETRALKGDTIFISSYDKFTFMDKYFVIIKYFEKNE